MDDKWWIAGGAAPAPERSRRWRPQAGAGDSPRAPSGVSCWATLENIPVVRLQPTVIATVAHGRSVQHVCGAADRRAGLRGLRCVFVYLCIYIPLNRSTTEQEGSGYAVEWSKSCTVHGAHSIECNVQYIVHIILYVCNVEPGAGEGLEQEWAVLRHEFAKVELNTFEKAVDLVVSCLIAAIKPTVFSTKHLVHLSKTAAQN